MYCVFSTPDGFLVSDKDTTVELAQTPFTSTDHVFVFVDAKPALKALLAQGYTVARPICLKTLHGLGLIQQMPVITPDNIPGAWHIIQLAIEAIEQQSYKRVARLECLLLPVIAAMETRGLYIDRDQLKQFIAHSQQQMDEAKKHALEYLGSQGTRDLFGESHLNLDSGLEVKEALEAILGVILPNTAHETLTALNHPAASAVVRYREFSKLVKTYGYPFLEQIDDKNRVHASFEPLGAGTGRMACHSPNLQNLPAAPLFRQAICAPAGKLLVTADYSACELRILAGLSGDEQFLAAFERDADLHCEVATAMFGVNVTKDENAHLRQQAKAINFGLMYGMGANALASQLGITFEQAEKLFTAYFRAYPTIRDYLDGLVDSALQKGYAETVLGRRLYLNSDKDISRIAKNMPIQGSAADMIKLAMLRLHDRLTTEFTDAALVNMIHDELVVECLEADATLVAQIVKEEMEAAQQQLIPNVKPLAQVCVSQVWGH